MRQVSWTTGWMLGHAAIAVSAMAFAGCGGGGSGGGGGVGSTAAGISSASATQLVAVEIAPPGDLTISEGMGNAFQVIVDGHYRDGGQLDLTRSIALRSSDETVARVGGDGLITPVGVGSAEITVSTTSFTGESLTARKRVTVVPAGAAPVFTGGRLAVYPQFRTLANVNSAAQRDQLQQVVIVGTDASGRMWDLTRVQGVTITDRNRAPTMAGQLSPTGLFRGVIEGEALLVTRIDSAGLSAGAHFVLGGGSARPLPPSALFSGQPLTGSTNPIDVALLSVLRGQFVEPSGLAGDQEFLRRLYSDAIGRLPNATELAAFETSTAANKRDAEIDRLVATPEFAAQWGKLIGEWFEIRMGNAPVFDTWAASQISTGQTMAQLVQALAAGTAGQASALFDATHPLASDKVDILVLTATGMTAECAVCHDHPLSGPGDTPRWTQAERYPLDAFFAANNAQATPLDKNNNRVGNPFQPGFVAFGSGIPVTSTLATPMAARRAEFGRLLTQTAQFDRGFAHRVFSEIVAPLLDPNQFLKRNLDAVAAPALLDTLGTRFRALNTDLRAFLAEIFKSKTYQLTSVGASAANDPLLARHALRRHHSEVVESLVAQTTGVALAAGELDFFRRTFGFPVVRASIAERTAAVNMSQSLVLMNSPIVQAKVTNNNATPATLAAQVAASTITQDAAITQLFRRALSRDPSADELGFARTTVTTAPTVRAGLEDVAAVLMSSIEAVSH